MIIQHNMPAINAHRQMGINTNNISKSLEKLSSGYRINRAGDDAAGLAISEKMRGQISGLNQATRNAQDGISLIQTAEGNLQETHAILQRMRELAVQSANGTYDNSTDRYNLDKEVEALKSEVDRIASSAEFNGRKLLDGTMSGAEQPGYGTLKVGDKVPNGANLIAFDTADNAKLAKAAGISITGEIKVTFAKAAATGTADANSVKAELSGDTLTITTTSDWDGSAAKAGGITAAAVQEKVNEALKDLEGVKVTFNKDLTTAADGAAKVGTTDLTGTLTTAKVADGTEVDATLITRATGDDTATAIPASDPKGALVLQIGANGVEDQRVSLEVDDMSSKGLKIDGISIATRTAANDAIDVIDKAINTVSSTRADLGALQNRLDHTINNLGVYNENLTAAESRIRDVDMAKEMMTFTKNQILQQASQAMLAQANALPQGVLQLLQ